jgi:hypothetical protein
MRKRSVGHYRVSTSKQGRSGLGLDAQRAAVRSFVESRGGTLLDRREEAPRPPCGQQAGSPIAERPLHLGGGGAEGGLHHR